MKPYYEDGSCTIYHGDAMDLLLEIPAAGCHVVTDPPYGVGIEYANHDDRDRGGYWPWMREVVETLVGAFPVVVFTHRVAALRELTSPRWDWVGVWHKPMAMSGLIQLPILPHWEPVFMYGITGSDLPRGSDVFTHTSTPATEYHPCPKPLPLFGELVARFGGPEVLDPFMGSGTTLRAAKDRGLRAVGIEKSERYCEIAAKRLAQEVLDFGEAQ